MPSKAELRAHFLKLRSELDAQSLQARSEALCRHLATWLQEQKIQNIAAFQSYRNEPLLDSLLSSFRKEQIFFPVVQAARGKMEFAAYGPSGDQHLNRYGIREPSAAAADFLKASQDTLILVPALSFDQQGYRLGYGAGYYDRYLNQFPGIQVGVCFEAFLCPELPRESHDRPVSYLVTEKAFYTFPAPTKS